MKGSLVRNGNSVLDWGKHLPPFQMCSQDIAGCPVSAFYGAGIHFPAQGRKTSGNGQEEASLPIIRMIIVQYDCYRLLRKVVVKCNNVVAVTQRPLVIYRKAGKAYDNERNEKILFYEQGRNR